MKKSDALSASMKAAQSILHIFVKYFRCRAYYVLQINSIYFAGQEYGLHHDAISSGLEFAIQQGWIEIVDLTSYRLTQKGFDTV